MGDEVAVELFGYVLLLLAFMMSLVSVGHFSTTLLVWWLGYESCLMLFLSISVVVGCYLIPSLF